MEIHITFSTVDRQVSVHATSFWIMSATCEEANALISVATNPV